MNKLLSMVSLCSSLALIPSIAAAKPGVKIMTAEELKYTAVPKAPPAVTMAHAFGSPKGGWHGAFHKFAAGFEAPLHWHTAGTHGVVVSGTVIMGPQGGPTKELGVGSFFSVPGKVKHTTTCKAGADCVMFVVASGKFDVKMAKMKKAADAPAAAPAAPASEEKKE